MRQGTRWVVLAIGIILLFLASPAVVSARPLFASHVTITNKFTNGLTGVPFQIDGVLGKSALPPPSFTLPFPDKQVKIFRKVGNRPWRRIATVITASDGSFSTTWTENRDGIRKYKAVFIGNARVRGSSDRFTATFA